MYAIFCFKKVRISNDIYNILQNNLIEVKQGYLGPSMFIKSYILTLVLEKVANAFL